MATSPRHKNFKISLGIYACVLKIKINGQLIRILSISVLEFTIHSNFWNCLVVKSDQKKKFLTQINRFPSYISGGKWKSREINYCSSLLSFTYYRLFDKKKCLIVFQARLFYIKYKNKHTAKVNSRVDLQNKHHTVQCRYLVP